MKRPLSKLLLNTATQTHRLLVPNHLTETRLLDPKRTCSNFS